MARAPTSFHPTPVYRNVRVSWGANEEHRKDLGQTMVEYEIEIDCELIPCPSTGETPYLAIITLNPLPARWQASGG